MCNTHCFSTDGYANIACLVPINLFLTPRSKWIINKYHQIKGGALTSFYRQRKASKSLKSQQSIIFGVYWPRVVNNFYLSPFVQCCNKRKITMYFPVGRRSWIDWVVVHSRWVDATWLRVREFDETARKQVRLYWCRGLEDWCISASFPTRSMNIKDH